MKSKIPRNRRAATNPVDDLEALHLELLRLYYDEGERNHTRDVADRLEAALLRLPETDDSIFAEEVRSLVAEVRGDLAEAIHSREGEVRKILELHSMTRGTPNWHYALRQYGYGDVSDRLDLLAILHAERGDLRRAVATLRESRAYCQSHQVAFDGKSLLAEYERQARGGRTATLASG